MRRLNCSGQPVVGGRRWDRRPDVDAQAQRTVSGRSGKGRVSESLFGDRTYRMDRWFGRPLGIMLSVRASSHPAGEMSLVPGPSEHRFAPAEIGMIAFGISDDRHIFSSRTVGARRKLLSSSTQSTSRTCQWLRGLITAGWGSCVQSESWHPTSRTSER